MVAVTLRLLMWVLLISSCKKQEIIEASDSGVRPHCQKDTGGTDEHLQTPFFLEEEVFKAGTNGLSLIPNTSNHYNY